MANINYFEPVPTPPPPLITLLATNYIEWLLSQTAPPDPYPIKIPYAPANEPITIELKTGPFIYPPIPTEPPIPPVINRFYTGGWG